LLDFKIVQFLNHLNLGFLGRVLEFLNRVVVLTFIVALIFALIIIFDHKNGWKVVLMALLALGFNFLVVNFLIKFLLPMIGLSRVRPYLAHPSSIHSIGELATDSSFPSGHVSVVTTIMTVVISYYRQYWPLALIFILEVAFERMYSGMHYPSDVLGGALLGLSFGYTTILAWSPISLLINKLFSVKINLS